MTLNTQIDEAERRADSAVIHEELYRRVANSWREAGEPEKARLYDLVADGEARRYAVAADDASWLRERRGW